MYMRLLKRYVDTGDDLSDSQGFCVGCNEMDIVPEVLRTILNYYDNREYLTNYKRFLKRFSMTITNSHTRDFRPSDSKNFWTEIVMVEIWKPFH